jgi:hypothetical protein
MKLPTEFSVPVILFVNNKIKVSLIHGCVSRYLTGWYLKYCVFGTKVKIQCKAGTTADIQHDIQSNIILKTSFYL